MHYVRHRKTDDWQEHGQGTYSVRLLPKTREQVKAAVLGSATTAEAEPAKQDEKNEDHEQEFHGIPSFIPRLLALTRGHEDGNPTMR